MRSLSILIIVFFTLFAFACGGNVKKSDVNKITQIYSGFDCGSGSRAAYVELVNESMMLERAFGKLTRQFSADRTPPPAVDFSKHRVVIVHMGQQPVAGYRLSLVSDTLKIQAQTAEIKMEWVKPKVGQMSAQVITNPCAAIKMPVAGYERIEIWDMQGEVRLRVDVAGG